MRLRCSQSCEERRSRRFLLALCMIMFFSERRQGPIRLPAGADEIVAGVRHAMSVLDHIRSGRASVVGAALLALVIAGPAPAQDPTKLKLSLEARLEGAVSFLLLAQDRGHFRSAGLDVSIDEGNS